MPSAQFIQKNARTAGLTYLIIIISSILMIGVGPQQLIVAEDPVSTVLNISNQPVLFRVGLTYDIFMYLCVIILSVALFNVLKNYNPGIAQAALLSRFGEAIVGLLTVGIGLLLLFLIDSYKDSEMPDELISLLLECKTVLLNLVFVLLAFGSVLYCYLFFRAHIIPRWISAFGIIAFLLVFIESMLVVLMDVESMLYTGIPAIIFELIIGFWLLFKGVTTDSNHSFKIENSR